MVSDVTSGSRGPLAFPVSHLLFKQVPWSDVMLCGIPCQCIKHSNSVDCEAIAAEDANPYLEYVFISVKMSHCAFQCERGLR